MVGKIVDRVVGERRIDEQVGREQRQAVALERRAVGGQRAHARAEQRLRAQRQPRQRRRGSGIGRDRIAPRQRSHDAARIVGLQEPARVVLLFPEAAARGGRERERGQALVAAVGVDRAQVQCQALRARRVGERGRQQRTEFAPDRAQHRCQDEGRAGRRRAALEGRRAIDLVDEQPRDARRINHADPLAGRELVADRHVQLQRSRGQPQRGACAEQARDLRGRGARRRRHRSLFALEGRAQVRDDLQGPAREGRGLGALDERVGTGARVVAEFQQVADDQRLQRGEREVAGRRVGGQPVVEEEAGALQRRVDAHRVRPRAFAARDRVGGDARAAGRRQRQHARDREPVRHGQRRRGQRRSAGRRLQRRAARHARDPAAHAAVGEEQAHCRAEAREHRRVGRHVPGERRVGAEHRRVLRRALDRHGQVQRPGRREADEGRHVHARQRRHGRWRCDGHGDAGQAARSGHRVTPSRAARRRAPSPPSPRPCPWH